MLSIQNVSYQYTKEQPILKNISFNVAQGEYIALLGESGCGKSTLVEIIYGLMDLKQGEIFYNNNKLWGPKFNIIPGHEFMKYLAQDFSLMPYTTVAENVGVFLSNIYKDIKRERVYELLEVVDMTEFADVKVVNLSGGQKQRVGIARVLAKEPKILLLDEPFSHIDNFRKNELRRKLFNYLKNEKITCIVATHDSTDALSFADSIYVIKNQEIIRQGNPQDIYNNPGSKYVGSFFNEINEVENSLLENPKKGTTLFYPEQVSVINKGKHKATVTQSYFKGHQYLITVNFKGTEILIAHPHNIEAGTEVLFTITL
ncbi:ABC transporter ATP-binding protein [Flavobacteriaceae bacterium]|nr:ABC transporter ATP-binding protein [Flavobacteriaceae bacterium]